MFQTGGFAETYVAGQVGYTVPNKLSNIKIDEDPVLPPGTTTNDFSLKNSLLYGAKVGHYFNSLRWLGLEVEAFRTTPHIKQQNVTFNVPGGCPLSTCSADLPGSTLGITTVAFNVVGRYPGERLQPYGAVGLGVFFAHLNDKTTGDSQNSNARPGLNTQLGLRYLVTKNISLFGEWKYNYVRFNFDPTPNLFQFAGTYSAHNFVFGVGYHFN
jgi:opacity protein-like surface antigen